jgi:hypothetical protein
MQTQLNLMRAVCQYPRNWFAGEKMVLAFGFGFWAFVFSLP